MVTFNPASVKMPLDPDTLDLCCLISSVQVARQHFEAIRQTANDLKDRDYDPATFSYITAMIRAMDSFSHECINFENAMCSLVQVD